MPPGRAGRLDVPGDVVEEHDLPGLDHQPPGRQRVDLRVGLDQPDLVRIHDVVGDVLETPAALPLASLGGRVAQDARQQARAQAGEPVEELTVQRADVPAPEVLDQLVGGGFVEPELASPRRPHRGRADLADPGIGRERPGGGVHRARREAAPALEGLREERVVVDLEHRADVEDDGADGHDPVLPITRQGWIRTLMDSRSSIAR